MTVRHLLAISMIFCLAALAWFLLGASVHSRTRESRAAGTGDVSQLWGDKHVQLAPRLYSLRERTVSGAGPLGDEHNGPQTQQERVITERIPIPPDHSRVAVDLAVDHRKRGLLWFDTYTVSFTGKYTAQVPDDPQGPLYAGFSLPSTAAIYDDFSLQINGVETALDPGLSHELRAQLNAQPGQKVMIDVRYRSRGLDTWRYRFADADVAQVRDFELSMSTDFAAIDFPPDTLSPTESSRDGDGWRLAWRFENLVSGKGIGMDLPNRMNPGPLVGRMTFFAPVSLLFFFTVLVMLGALSLLRLHPMHYFFLAAAFFAFHLLMAYLADHLSIHSAFLLSAAVSLALVLSYLRLVCGVRSALLYAGTAQLVYLFLFSYAFFFSGFTGLAITVGAILTLFVLMQLTGRLDWDGVFAGQRPT